MRRTRKQRKIRGGSRSQVISNYWGTCRFEKGRKKTRCLLDKQRGFWDAHGFKGKVYHIYEDKAAKEAFLQNVRESNKKRISDYLDENSNENDRFLYRYDPWNDLSDDTVEFKKYDYAQLTANDHLKKLKEKQRSLEQNQSKGEQRLNDAQVILQNLRKTKQGKKKWWLELTPDQQIQLEVDYQNGMADV